MADNDKSTEKIEEKGGISVQTEHIFPIIKKWLYSEKEIFLREIVSNASDAVTKLRRLISLGEVHDIDDEGFKITVTVDKAAGTLTVSDNGIGMTEEEVKNIYARSHFRARLILFQNMKTQTEERPELSGISDLDFTLRLW